MQSNQRRIVLQWVGTGSFWSRHQPFAERAQGRPSIERGRGWGGASGAETARAILGKARPPLLLCRPCHGPDSVHDVVGADRATVLGGRALPGTIAVSAERAESHPRPSESPGRPGASVAVSSGGGDPSEPGRSGAQTQRARRPAAAGGRAEAGRSGDPASGQDERAPTQRAGPQRSGGAASGVGASGECPRRRHPRHTPHTTRPPRRPVCCNEPEQQAQQLGLLG